MRGVPEEKLKEDMYRVPWAVAVGTGRILPGARVRFFTGFDPYTGISHDTWPLSPLTVRLVSEKTGEEREMVADLVDTGHRQCEARFVIGVER